VILRQILFAIRSIKSLRKSCSALAPKVLVKFGPGDVEEELDLGVCSQVRKFSRIPELQVGALGEGDAGFNAAKEDKTVYNYFHLTLIKPSIFYSLPNFPNDTTTILIMTLLIMSLLIMTLLIATLLILSLLKMTLLIMTLLKMTVLIMTLLIMTLLKMTVLIMTLLIMTVLIMTLLIMSLLVVTLLIIT
jgi:hypothetical protein